VREAFQSPGSFFVFATGREKKEDKPLPMLGGPLIEIFSCLYTLQ
jgi:hypothetical protein